MQLGDPRSCSAISGCPEFHSKIAVCNQNFQLTCRYLILILIYMKPGNNSYRRMNCSQLCCERLRKNRTFTFDFYNIKNGLGLFMNVGNIWSGIFCYNLKSCKQNPDTEALEETKRVKLLCTCIYWMC